jgi:hypothetical protein
VKRSTFHPSDGERSMDDRKIAIVSAVSASQRKCSGSAAITRPG